MERSGAMHAHDGYLPIAEHGVIGDLHSIALVGTEGTIDWFCCPTGSTGRASSPRSSTPSAGGYFRVAPATEGWTSKQLYVPDTNVLITRFLSQEGIGEVLDFMPVDDRAAGHRQQLIRRVLCVRGEVHFRVEVEPRFDYGRERPARELVEGGAVFASPSLTLSLSSAVPLDQTELGVRGEFTLTAGESATFVLEEGDVAVPV